MRIWRRYRLTSPATPTTDRMARARVWVLLLLGLWLGLAALAAQPFWWGDQVRPAADIALAKLPPEARQTVRLIRRGGPFPYARDGAVFGNREGRLPAQRRGYYREYTVVTPGARDRGARRIVAGRSGEYWYTADHYRSFQRVRE